MMGRTFAARVQLLACLALPTGCKGNGPKPSEDTKPVVAVDSTQKSAFVYEPTLRKVVAPDIPVAVVMEVELPDSGELYILAAVARERPALELHHFETKDGIVQPDGADPVQPIRLAPDDEALANLGELRRTFNAPGSTRRRPIGLDVEAPGALVAELTQARQEFEQGSHQALATLLRGLSDAIVFERDAVPEALEALAGLGEFETTMHGERRAELVGAESTIVCHRRSGGWVVFDY